MESDNKPPNDSSAQTDGQPSEIASRTKYNDIQAPRDQADSYEKKHPLEWAIFILLLLTLIATSFAALYTRNQWMTAVDALHASQRPWVFAESVKSISQYKSLANDGRFSILSEIVVKNYGTSVANEGQAQMRASTGSGDFLKKNWDRACFDVENARPAIESGQNWPTGFSLPPNGGESALHLGTEEPTITPQNIKDGSFYLIGCMSYFDQYRIKHTTTFCFRPRKIADSARVVTTNYNSVSDMEFVICNGFQKAD
jgi:hypothetical protein